MTAPAVSAEDQHILAAGNRAFAMDLYRQLRSTDGNLIFSPYSISLALAMTCAGARGETARQMGQAAQLQNLGLLATPLPRRKGHRRLGELLAHR